MLVTCSSRKSALGWCTELRELRLSENRLSGPVPAPSLAKLRKVEQLALHAQEGGELTITAAGCAEIQRSAAPGVHCSWPRVV